MPHARRVEYPGAIDHVMDRGDRREDLFVNDVDRQDLIKTLGEACKKTGCQVHAYCLARNHFHLVLKTPNAKLVEGMWWFLSAYTIRPNHRQKLIGHVFGGRYNTHCGGWWHRGIGFLVFSLLLAALPLRADTRYVWAGSPSPSSPYADWHSAAHTIQEAVNGAAGGDVVVVTNGVYSTGGKVTPGGSLSNRVVATVAVGIESVNGPEATWIVGQGPLGTNAVRCVYMEGGAVLSGFTLTNGCTRTAGSAWLDQAGGGAYLGEAILTNCIVSGCQAKSAGGGISGGSAVDCQIRTNTASSGGGCQDCVLEWCTVEGNRASDSGGGLHTGSAKNCVIRGNWAGGFGGGTSDAPLDNSLITGNTADVSGGGVSGGDYVANCTVVYNTCPQGGAGVSSAYVSDSIVYFNLSTCDANYEDSTFEYSCTTPDPGGNANLTADPALVDAGHLAASSPCTGRGWYALDTDLDGDPWLDPPCIGCDQYPAGGATGPLVIAVRASPTNAAVGFAFDFEAVLQGTASSNLWSFGDGCTLTNAAFATHTWSAPGLYPVVLTAFNDTYPAGVSATAMVSVVTQPVHYVNPQNLAPQFPYSDWAKAAIHIQDAINACDVPGSKVVVADGVYASDTVFSPGCLLPARFAVSNAAIVESLNGPATAVIVGQGPVGLDAVRCVFLDRNTRLSGFTLSHGCTRRSGNDLDGSGGGAFARFASLSNCVLTANAAGTGGGVFLGTLDQCVLSSNTAAEFSGAGGAAYRSRLRGCTVSDNRGRDGGGAFYSELTNCTVSRNIATFAGGGLFYGTARQSLISGNISDSGGGAYGSVLADCTLSGNSATNEGGGLYSGTAARSIIASNTAVAYDGGGARSSTLIGCLVVGNTSGHEGGGASYCELAQCTVCDNTAVVQGGGTHRGQLTNCIVYYNTCTTEPNFSPGTLQYCCTTPATDGAGNLTNEPAFVNRAAGNYRLRYGSPCLDAGRALSAEAAWTDLDGVVRPLDGNFDAIAAWDVGAYEYNAATADSDEDRMPDAWEIRFGLNPINVTDAAANSDGDACSNYEEWVADTNPTNAASCFQIALASNRPPWMVVFTSSASRLYRLECCTNLTGPISWMTVGDPSPVRGSGGMMAFSDTNIFASRFYRVSVVVP
jgi:PKD repeat protein/REP element-mobilizing transposase RayT